MGKFIKVTSENGDPTWIAISTICVFCKINNINYPKRTEEYPNCRSMVFIGHDYEDKFYIVQETPEEIDELIAEAESK